MSDTSIAARQVVRQVTTSLDWQQATALLHDHVGWMRAATHFDPLAEQPALAAELDDLAGHYPGEEAALFVAFDGDVPAGIVAIRCHEDGSAELKRMYVRPFARGRGFADALVATALDGAGHRGCRSVWLETVRGVMDPAIAVYRRHGFTEAPERGRTLGIDGIVVMQRTIDSRPADATRRQHVHPPARPPRRRPGIGGDGPHGDRRAAGRIPRR